MRFYATFLIALLVVGCTTETAPPVTTGDHSHIADGKAYSVLSWNIESDGSDSAKVGEKLSELITAEGAAIVALQEVPGDDAPLFVPTGWESVLSGSGGRDRLQVVFDPRYLELLDQSEPTRLAGIEVNPGNHRSPQMVLLRDKETGIEFWLVNVHQARGNEDLRNQQAIALREWARSQSKAVLVIGDLNFDYDFRTRQGNASFGELVRDNILEWIEPKELIDTNWSDRNGDGIDDYPDSMLDGVLVAGPAKDWRLKVDVIVEPGDFPDDSETSDHRPIRTYLPFTHLGRE